MSRRIAVAVAVGLSVVLGLVVLVLASRPAAAPPIERMEDLTPIVVVRTLPSGAVTCSYLVAEPGGEGPLLYHWTGPRLQAVRCKPRPSGGMVGLH